MVFGTKELYVNIQEQLSPMSISWDFKDPTKWLPFYCETIPAKCGLYGCQTEVPGFPLEEHPVNKVQDKKLEYTEVNWDRAADIENSIKVEVRNLVESSWPFDAPPRWMPIKLRPQLQDLERFKKGTGPKPEIAMELAKLERNNTVRGYPLNCSYLDTDSIVRQVLDTGVHKAVQQNTSFGLEVFASPYVAGVFSVWVFFVSLTPARRDRL